MAVEGNVLVAEEALDLLGNLCRLVGRLVVVWRPEALLVPVVDKSLEHAIRSKFMDLTQPAEGGEFIVGLRKQRS